MTTTLTESPEFYADLLETFLCEMGNAPVTPASARAWLDGLASDYEVEHAAGGSDDNSLEESGAVFRRLATDALVPQIAAGYAYALRVENGVCIPSPALSIVLRAAVLRALA